MEYTTEQYKIAYLMNLCTVSISQIIDTNDTYFMEQEYNNIFNNLNFQVFPKGKLRNFWIALKHIQSTMFSQRLTVGERAEIRQDYQEKLTNAIWKLVPGLGQMIERPDNRYLEQSELEMSIGTEFTSYRKFRGLMDGKIFSGKKAIAPETMRVLETQRRDLFAQINSLLQDDKTFPAELFLTERQVDQMVDVLKDKIPQRRYDRMNAIQAYYEGYPPFRYYFGHTANQIYLKNPQNVTFAAEANVYYGEYCQAVKGYGILRNDCIYCACLSEMVDLAEDDIEEKKELLSEAIRYSGWACDIVQLAAINYLEMKERELAKKCFLYLVNEQYNLALNAQLLSSLYISDELEYSSLSGMEQEVLDIRNAYKTLRSRTKGIELFPILREEESVAQAQRRFLQSQRRLLQEQYIQVLRTFMINYMYRYGRLFPVMPGESYEDSYFEDSDVAIARRKRHIKRIFEQKSTGEAYLEALKKADLPRSILKLLNEMFEATCGLDFVDARLQEQLSQDIVEEITYFKDTFNDWEVKLQTEEFSIDDVFKMLKVTFFELTEIYFKNLRVAAIVYTKERTSNLDFVIAKKNLVNFCRKEGIPDPDQLYGKKGKFAAPKKKDLVFTTDLYRSNADKRMEARDGSENMIILMEKAIPGIVGNAKPNVVEFYTNRDSRIHRYIGRNEELRANNYLKSYALAVFDDKKYTGDFDLIFTIEGVIPVRDGKMKPLVAYHNIKPGKQCIFIGGAKFTNSVISLHQLFDLFESLAEQERELPKDKTAFMRPEAKGENLERKAHKRSLFDRLTIRP